TMKPRPMDNLRSLLDGGSPAWIPFTLDVGAICGLTEPILRKFRQETGADDHNAYFDTDNRLFSLASRFGGSDPSALHAHVEPGTTFDEWGIGHWAGGTEGSLDKAYPPLARAETVREIEAHPSPVIETGSDTSAVARFHQAGYPVFGYAGSIYEWSWWLRGMEQFMMDLLSDPEIAEALIRKVEAHTTQLALATAQAGVDVLCFYDDAGMQSGMQIKPELWRRFIKPAWRRVLDTVRRQHPHARFFFHCCGKIDAIVRDVIEAGFHVLHPVQPECMDFEATYRQYGRDIALAATIAAQRIFPFGSPDDVRREVRRPAGIAHDSRTAADVEKVACQRRVARGLQPQARAGVVTHKVVSELKSRDRRRRHGIAPVRFARMVIGASGFPEIRADTDSK
ncbi:MAG: hypothetical protein N2689_15215, partial [Verrucomicrobiae bacterium]|nr:hypothetical protein [Verrucomicrobiae bacterium]